MTPLESLESMSLEQRLQVAEVLIRLSESLAQQAQFDADVMQSIVRSLTRPRGAAGVQADAFVEYLRSIIHDEGTSDVVSCDDRERPSRNS
jgi:hypothetical protein